MTKVETRVTDRLGWDEADVRDVLGEMYLTAAREGKVRRRYERLSKPTYAVLFECVIDKAHELIGFYEPHVHYVSDEPSDNEPDAEICIDLTYRTVNAYSMLPPARAISRIAKLQYGMYQALSYAAGFIQQLSTQVGADQPMLSVAAPGWVEESIQLELRGNREQSLDLLFDTIDEMLLASQFAECDRCISSMPVDRLANAQLLTILTATSAARKHLPSRGEFYRKTRDELAFRGADADALLVGLE